jgi:DNA topoisomerase IB
VHSVVWNSKQGIKLLILGEEGDALFESAADVQTIVDPKDAAESAGLRYVSDARPGIRRRKSGKGFTYTRADGTRLTERDVLGRIKSLAIPPAWTDVWICPFADGHIQATGRDAKGRKQYRYHPRFREVRESTKYEHVVAFAEALPTIRSKVREHMGLRGLPREKVLATVVHLLQTTLIRVGNDDYAKQNNSYGLTTLKTRHVAVDGNEVRFRFTGKSGKQWSLRVRDRRIAKIIRSCQERNTPTICRKCYVHPDVLTSYLDGNLVLEIKKAVENELRDELSGLQPEEAAVLAMLRGRLTKEAGERDERARAA